VIVAADCVDRSTLYTNHAVGSARLITAADQFTFCYVSKQGVAGSLFTGEKFLTFRCKRLSWCRGGYDYDSTAIRPRYDHSTLRLNLFLVAISQPN